MTSVPKMVSIRTIARALDMERHKVLRLIARGTWPGAVKVGGHWRIPEKEVVEWLSGPPAKEKNRA